MISCLVAACYLQLTDLCIFCSDYIQECMSSLDHVFEFASMIQNMNCSKDGIIGELGSDLDSTVHQADQVFLKLVSTYHTKLFKACLGTVLYTSSLCSFEDDAEENYTLSSDHYHYPKLDAPIPLCVFLAQLPLVWIEKVVSCDCLVIQSEFERYHLVKQILHKRQARVNLDTICQAEGEAEDEEADEEKTGIYY